MADENVHPTMPPTPASITPARTKFAVFIPCNDSLTGVYDSKAEALSVVQGHKGARFAPVRGEEDAMDFFSFEKQSISTPRPPPPGFAEESCPYATPALFGEVMSAINRSDIGHLQTLIDNNPLYLVTKVDSPTILHQGARYNALHVCANKDLVDVARFIINVLRSGVLFSRLYPNDLPETRQSRINRVLDMYINSPDRHRAETPLHFAAKMGNADMVWLLVSQQECCIDTRNVDGKTPAEINCSRVSVVNEEKRLRIESALRGQYYVPILRSFTNPLEPLVRPPIRGTSDTVKANKLLNGEDANLYRVSAYMGPMSQDAAKDIYETLTKPSRRRRRLNDSLRLDSSLMTPNRSLLLETTRSSPMAPRRPDPCVADPKYGLENCARQVSQLADVPFFECFEFLKGDGLDVSSHDGFCKMEDFLRTKHSQFCHGCDLCQQIVKTPVRNDYEERSVDDEKDHDKSSSHSSCTASASVLRQPFRNNDNSANYSSWKYLTEPVKWAGRVVSVVAGFFFHRPATPQKALTYEPPTPRETVQPEANQTPTNRPLSDIHQLNSTLSDSFIQQFASMKLTSFDETPRVKPKEQELNKSNNSSQSFTESEPQTMIRKKQSMFFGNALCRPSDEDFHIFYLINGDDKFGKEFLLSPVDYPFLSCWYEQVRYVKEHTLNNCISD